MITLFLELWALKLSLVLKTIAVGLWSFQIWLICLTTHWSNVDDGASPAPVASGHVLHPQLCTLNHRHLQTQPSCDPPPTHTRTRLISSIFFHLSSLPMPALLSTMSSPPNLCLVRSNAASWKKKKTIRNLINKPILALAPTLSYHTGQVTYVGTWFTLRWHTV